MKLLGPLLKPARPALPSGELWLWTSEEPLVTKLWFDEGMGWWVKLRKADVGARGPVLLRRRPFSRKRGTTGGSAAGRLGSSGPGVRSTSGVLPCCNWAICGGRVTVELMLMTGRLLPLATRMESRMAFRRIIPVPDVRASPCSCLGTGGMVESSFTPFAERLRNVRAVNQTWCRSLDVAVNLSARLGVKTMMERLKGTGGAAFFGIGVLSLTSKTDWIVTRGTSALGSLVT